MNEKRDERMAYRLRHRKLVKISLPGCRTPPQRGEVIDSSTSGIGIFAPMKLRVDDIILLRVQDAMADWEDAWPHEAGPFHMLSAKVRWCREELLPDGTPAYRIGVERMLPYY